MRNLFFIAVLASYIFAFVDNTPSYCKEDIINELNSLSLKNPVEVESLYKKGGNTLLWDEEDLNDLLDASTDHIKNYLFLDYHQNEIEDLMVDIDNYDENRRKEIRTKIDILATDGFFSLAKDLNEGFIDWDKFQSLLDANETDLVWEKSKKNLKYDKDLLLALKTNMLEVLFERYQPSSSEYKKLIEAYHRFGNIKFPTVDYGKLLKVGDYGYRASQLKAYLKATGDLKDVDKEYIEFPTFDEKLANALKRFQKRHYLKPTGELDRVTVLYTRMSVAKKRELIKLNIERHKLFGKIYEGEYIKINIPEFSLKYYKNATMIDDIFVVVGREDRPTPIFNDLLEYIVLNPSWVVPRGLMRKDYIPKLISNPNSLLDEGIHIHTKPYKSSREIDPTTVNWEQYLLDEKKAIPYYFVQYAGEDNVLGAMKFIFPNRYNVYLHDTNAKSLTTLKYRLYSSGCIRLSKPYKLLAILSEHTKYNIDELAEMIESKKTVNISLKKKIPIYIRYFTVFIDKDAGLSFRKDFYGLDTIQFKAMSKTIQYQTTP
jgi:murein L,D-transpeptidase YcbB/YkuD